MEKRKCNQIKFKSDLSVEFKVHCFSCDC